ncbi:MAG: imidazoleglycerol-phosphate dehydratase HisB [Clostridia bacterium]|nr:imidazoleglycerol-phosphate dehydratase HisB [Clostridia bacterium]
MRTVTINRTTKETDINLTLNIDGKGVSNINTGCGFFNHMLELFARHARFDLSVTCKGDIEVDYHHTVEDVGIVLGQALKKALGDMRGIVRYGTTILPMDESLILTAIDISGRSYLKLDMPVRASKIGDFPVELVEEFFLAFVRHAGLTLHVVKMAGTNAHHVVEGTFKSFARSLKTAVSIDKDFASEIPSTKGVL